MSGGDNQKRQAMLDTTDEAMDDEEEQRRTNSTQPRDEENCPQDDDEDEEDDDKSNLMVIQKQHPNRTSQSSFAPYSLMKRTWFLVWIIVFVGLTVSTGFWVLGMTGLRREGRLRLDQETAGISASIRTAWNDFKLAGLWIHQACNAPAAATSGSSSNNNSSPNSYSNEVICTRQEFRGLYEVISVLSFRFISYVPNVTNAMRPVLEQEAAQYYAGRQPEPLQEQSWKYTGFQGIINASLPDSPENVGPRANNSAFYFPMHTLEPKLGNEWLIDLDLYSSQFKGQLQTAVSSMYPMASQPMALGNNAQQQQHQQRQILLLVPGAPVTAWNITDRSIGVAALGVGFQDILQRAANTHTSVDGKALIVYMFDTTLTDDVQYFGGARVQYPTASAADDSSLMLQAPIITPLEPLEYSTLVSKSRQKTSQTVMTRQLIMDNFQWTIFMSFDNQQAIHSSEQMWARAWIVIGAVMMFATCCVVALCLRSKLKRETVVSDIRQAAQAEKAALMVRHAEQQVQMERELNDYLAHEVRNPLAAAISACSFLSSSNEEQRMATVSTTFGPHPQQDTNAMDAAAAAADKNKEDIEVIHASLHFIDDLLRSMLDMHKAASQQLTLVETYTDVTNDIFEPVRSMFLSHRFEKFEFLIDCPPQLILWVDRMRLKQVVLNLAGNSRKFTSQGFIRLVARVVDDMDGDGESVEIAVEDSGPGIPASKRERVFERFQESLDSLQQGTGMGLSLCKTLVNLMGGELELDPFFDSGIPGFPGTRFVIRLLDQKPLDMDAVDLEQAANAQLTSDQREMYYTPTPVAIPRGISSVCSLGSNAPSVLSQQLPKHLSVLIVDDDMIIRKMFRRLLSRLESSWTYDEAANGETALKMTEQKTYDVIFMDQYMASVEKQLLGTEAVVALRSRGVRSCICGLSANEMKHEFELSGANGFMRKPFPSNTKELTNCLIEVLEKGGFMTTREQQKALSRSLRSSISTNESSSIRSLRSLVDSNRSLASDYGGNSTRSVRSQTAEFNGSLRSGDGPLVSEFGGGTSTFSLRSQLSDYSRQPIPVIAEVSTTTNTSSNNPAAPSHNNDVDGNNTTAESKSPHHTKDANTTAESKSPQPAENTHTTKELPKNLCVLTVDDDKTLRKMIGRSINRVEPTWTVEEASCGEAALDMVDQKRYDLIFMDQYMVNVEKGLLGTETVQALRAKGIRSSICGLSANSLEVEFQESGANGFIRKPLPMKKEELTKHLAGLLENDTFFSLSRKSSMGP